MRTHVELELGGKRYRLVPGPRALLEIADKVGDPMQLVIEAGGVFLGLAPRRAGLRPPPTAKVFGVLRTVLLTSPDGQGLTADQANELLFRRGVAQLYAPYADVLGALVNGGVVLDEPAEPPAGSPEKNRAARRSTGRRSSRGSGA
jgi:hypothetical protein